MGEAKRKALAGKKQSVALDTFGGRLHVEGDSTAVTPLGQLSFFLDFLKVSGLFDAWVEECPLSYQSNNASDKRDVLATLFLSILAGLNRSQPLHVYHDDTPRQCPAGVVGGLPTGIGGCRTARASKDGRM